MNESTTKKKKTGRPPGSKDRPRRLRMAEQLERALIDVFKGTPVLDNEGKPMIEPATGRVVRKPPNAAMLREIRGYLNNTGTLAKMVRDGDGGGVAGLVNSLLREGKLGLRRPGRNDEDDETTASPVRPSEADPSWGAKR